ncbi:Trafficking protein particle complex subunit 12 [Nowakowskiella sp. JEL0407]|nr:Trafficking protein particle complex subunit 12 [Nowakowskiella sp. JEL0407]
MSNPNLIQPSNAPIPFNSSSSTTEFDFLNTSSSLEPTVVIPNSNKIDDSKQLPFVPPSTPPNQNIETGQQPTQPLDPNPLKPPTKKSTHTRTASQPQVDAKYYKLPTKRWIDITVFYDIPPVDPVLDLLSKHARPETTRQRKLKSFEDNESDPTALSIFLKTNSWRAVAKLARKRLLACHPGQIDEIMRLWFLRLTAMVRLKLYEVVALELERLGEFDAPELVYEKYPDVFPGRSGKMVSLELFLFSAQFPGVKGGEYLESVNRIYKIIYPLKFLYAGLERVDERREVVWTQLGVCQMAVINNLLELKDYETAIELMRGVIEEYGVNPDILSALGRIYMQLGDIVSAKNTFARVEQIVMQQHVDGQRMAWNRPDLVLMNRAYLHMAENDWESSTSLLTELLTIDPSNAVAVNNLAVSQLYMGNVGQAISFLESIAIDMPATAGVCESLLFNLATLFDLTDQSTERKKKILANVVSKYAGDDFAVECLKL